MLRVFFTQVRFDTHDATELSLVAQCQQVIQQYREDQSRRRAAEKSAQAVLQAELVDNVPPKPAMTAQQERNMVHNGLASSARTESPEFSPTKNEQANEPGRTKVPSEKEAIAALRAMMDAKGLPAVKQLLDKFGVTRVGELTPLHRTEFVARATQEAQNAGGAQ